VNFKSLMFGLALTANLSLDLSAAGEPANPSPAAASLAFTGNAYDFLQFVSYKRNLKIAIDPDALQVLVKTDVEIATPSTQSNSELLDRCLKSRGFIVQDMTLTTGVSVAFVTTPDGWAYLQAVSAMKRGNIQLMYNSLSSIKDEQTSFGAHCAVLKKALVTITQRNQQMSQVEAEIQKNVAGFISARNDLKMADMIASRSRSSNPQGLNTDITKARYEKAVADAEKSHQALDALFQKMVASNLIIGDAFDAAYNAGYASEAAFLFEQLYSSYVRYRNVLGTMQKEGLLRSEKNLSEVPKSVQELRVSLRDSKTAAEADLNRAAQALNERDYPTARQFYARAYWEDRTLPLARGGIGYCDLQRNATALKSVLDDVIQTSPTERSERLEKECREREQVGLLRALVDRRTEKQSTTQREPITKLGVLNGLGVTCGKGGLLPVAVRIENIPAAPKEKKDEESYWDSVVMKELQQRDYPVSFGDYGQKDPYMFLAATEAYKWLSGIDGAVTGRTGLQVEFQELLGGKAGDSAGAAIAAAAYSSLRRVPLRQDVAMTGSVHGNGAVTGVGLVPVKVAGAIAVKGIQVVIVPEENAADLATLSLEELCRVTIVTGKDIRTYLKYATSLGIRSTAEQREASKAISLLQDAQVRLLLGENTAALQILLSAADCPSEIYSVHRLLELLLAKQMADGKLTEAKALQAQLNDALTKRTLASQTRDYEIPVTTTERPVASVAEVKRPEPPFSPYNVSRPSRPSIPTPRESQDTLVAEKPTILGRIGLQQVVWEAWPFPKDSNWPGPRGRRAKIDNDGILLEGQPVFSQNSYPQLRTIECEVTLEKMNSTDGCVWISIFSNELPHDREIRNPVTLTLGYQRPGGRDGHLTLDRADGSSVRLNTDKFSIEEGKSYRVRIEFLHNTVRVTVDGQKYEVTGVNMSFAQPGIRIMGWQPTNLWRVRNFSIR